MSKDVTKVLVIVINNNVKQHLVRELSRTLRAQGTEHTVGFDGIRSRYLTFEIRTAEMLNRSRCKCLYGRLFARICFANTTLDSKSMDFLCTRFTNTEEEIPQWLENFLTGYSPTMLTLSKPSQLHSLISGVASQQLPELSEKNAGSTLGGFEYTRTFFRS